MVNPTVADDKRQRSRVRSSISISVQKELLGESIRATIHDLNWYGAGLEVEASVHEGEVLHLTIPVPDSGEILRTKGKVVWAQRKSDEPIKTLCGVYFFEQQPVPQQPL